MRLSTKGRYGLTAAFELAIDAEYEINGIRKLEK